MENSSRGRSPHQIAALTGALARGDEAAFREFFDAYFDRLLRYLLVVTGGDEPAAREALQAALIRVARHAKPFDTEEKFWSWLTVLARTALADESKKQRRWFAFLERFSRHAEVENSFGNDGEADEKLRELLEKNLSSLPPDERELIAQKYFSHRSVRDIAGARQATEKAVESKLSRVRRKLKDALFDDLKNERPL
ncbi:MAG TPA: sigma-70 family RNA polymerase sigma factor [Verrucomicrobiae bacterium]